MRFIADENISAAIVDALLQDGHDILIIGNTARGIDDETVLAFSTQENRILITHDDDFSSLTFKDALQSGGVVLLRLHRLKDAAQAERVRSLMQSHGTELSKAFTILEPGRIRVRRIEKKI